MTGSPSRVPVGQKDARNVEIEMETKTAAISGLDGSTDQKNPSCVRQEKSVRKVQRETCTNRHANIITQETSANRA